MGCSYLTSCRVALGEGSHRYHFPAHLRSPRVTGARAALEAMLPACRRLPQNPYTHLGEARRAREDVQYGLARKRNLGGTTRGEHDARSPSLSDQDGKAGVRPASSLSVPARAPGRERRGAARPFGGLCRAATALQGAALCLPASVVGARPGKSPEIHAPRGGVIPAQPLYATWGSASRPFSCSMAPVFINS